MLTVAAVAHVLLAFVAPALLVAGAPLALTRRALGPRGSGGIAWVRRRPFVRVLGRPLPAVAVFAAVLLALPLGLLDRLLPSQGGRQLVDLLLLSTGWLVAAVLAARRPAGGWLATGVVLALPLTVGAVLLARPDVLAATYFRSLGLPWVPELAVEQDRAGIIWAVGTVAVLPLLLLWWRSRRPAGTAGAVR